MLTWLAIIQLACQVWWGCGVRAGYPNKSFASDPNVGGNSDFNAVRWAGDFRSLGSR